MQGFLDCWSSCSNGFMNFLFFFFYNGPYAGFIILEWWADLNLLYISSHSTFSCNVMTLLCFLGTLPASLVIVRMGPMVLFRVYGIALNTMENTQES